MSSREGFKLRAFVAKVRGFLRGRRRDAEFDEEVQEHLQLLAERFEAQGMTKDDAASAARRQFGNTTLLQQDRRELQTLPVIESLWEDLRFATRVLGKSPGFTLIALLTLTLGLGINCAIFTVVNAVLLRPLAYPDSGRLVLIERHFPEITIPAASVTKFLFWREHSRVFESMTGYSSASSGVNLTGAREPEHLRSLRVSADFFLALGVQPVLGRSFTPDEDRPGGPNAVVISYELWRRRFGGDSAILGRAIQLSGQLWTVVGVAPPGFDFTEDFRRFHQATDLWTPLRTQPNPKDEANIYGVLGRLRRGLSYAQATQDLRAVDEQLRREHPDLMAPRESVVIRSYQDAIVGDIRPALLLLQVAVGFVLLIACANLANLLLSRSTVRRKEMAVRLALGADRLRLTRQLLIESAVLTFTGGGLGLAAATAGLPLLLRMAPQGLPRLGEVRIDWHVWLFVFVAALVTGVLFGLAPAIQGAKTELRDALQESTGRIGTSRGVTRLQRLLVVGEVGVSAVLLVGAGLLIQTFWRLQHASPGFDVRQVLTAQMTLDHQQYNKTAAVALLEEKALNRLESLPGVEAAAAVTSLPVEQGLEMNFAIEENPSGGDPSGSTEWRAITPHYLRVMHIPVLRGRGLTDGDNGSGAPVVLVNQAFAERFFPNQDPLGQHIVIGAGAEAVGLADRTREVIGIVGNTKEYGLASPAPATFFVPAAQVQDDLTAAINQGIPLVWVVRTAGDPRLLSRAVQQNLLAVATQEAPDNFRTMEDVLSASIAQQRFNMLLLTLFAGMAVTLGAVGLYGVLSYLVAQRTHEIGVRMALGANRGKVLRLVVTNGLRMTLAGLGLGILAALGLTRLLVGFLYGVKSTDPFTFAAVTVLLCGVAFLACYVPARRATRVDPLVALRYE